MKNRNIFFFLTTLTIGVFIGLFIYYKYFSRTINPKEFIEQIRRENKTGFDSLQRAFNYDNELNFRINDAINKNDFKTAYALIDSLPPFGKKHSKHLYNGMIYEKQKRYSKAIEEYTEALNEIPYSKAESLRAELYVKMDKLKLALTDYKNIYEYNHYYSIHIAKVFELMKQKDSALKYYKIYLEHYPSDSVVQQTIFVLQK